MRKIICGIALIVSPSLYASDTTAVIPGKFDTLIPVLTFGTFHMGNSNDAHTTEFDEHNSNNIREVHKIAAMIAAFKPTVIVVETEPQYDAGLQREYRQYLENPQMKFEYPTETELLAYEAGRLAGTGRIYGIDYKESYNYMIHLSVPGSKDSAVYNRYLQTVATYAATHSEATMPLLQTLRQINQPLYLDFMININADILTHIASEHQAEGADEAARYYHRNLVMYSNFNKIPLTKDDRVFILSGASHIAFFNDFLKRSPKYQLINVLDFLN